MNHIVNEFHVLITRLICLFFIFDLDLPPVYTYPAIAMGYKEGPSPHEAQLAEQATIEVEPAQPDAKALPHPCLIQPLAEKQRQTGEDGTACEVVASQSGCSQKEEEETRLEAKGCSISEPESNVSGLPPCPSPAPVPDQDYMVTSPGKAQKVELSLGFLGQKSLEEPQQSKEQESEENHGKEDSEEDEAQKMGLKQFECTVSVPGELVEQEKQVEEDRGQERENVKVVEDEEEEERRGMSPREHLVQLTSNSPASSPSSDFALPPTPSTAAQLEGAYMWSLELLIAAALCATRDALYPPAPSLQVSGPPSHHGMELLGEVAELEIQQRSRKCNEKDSEGVFIFLSRTSRIYRI